MFLWWQTVGSWNFGAWHYSAAGRAGSARLFHPSPDCALQSDDVDGHFRRAGPVESHEQRNFTSKFLGREREVLLFLLLLSYSIPSVSLRLCSSAPAVLSSRLLPGNSIYIYIYICSCICYVLCREGLHHTLMNDIILELGKGSRSSERERDRRKHLYRTDTGGLCSLNIRAERNYREKSYKILTERERVRERATHKS